MLACPSINWVMRMSTPSVSRRQRFPGGLNRRLAVAAGAAEDERVRAEGRAPRQNRREPSVRVERDAPVLLVLRRRAGNPDLTGVPVDTLVLDQQHLAAAAAQFQCADDAVVQHLADALM